MRAVLCCVILTQNGHTTRAEIASIASKLTHTSLSCTFLSLSRKVRTSLWATNCIRHFVDFCLGALILIRGTTNDFILGPTELWHILTLLRNLPVIYFIRKLDKLFAPMRCFQSPKSPMANSTPLKLVLWFKFGIMFGMIRNVDKSKTKTRGILNSRNNSWNRQRARTSRIWKTFPF